MKLTPAQIKSLMELLHITRDEEINCNECLGHVGEFAELKLKGKTIPKALETVEHHLSLCMECREEYESLLKALMVLEAN